MSSTIALVVLAIALTGILMTFVVCKNQKDNFTSSSESVEGDVNLLTVVTPDDSSPSLNPESLSTALAKLGIIVTDDGIETTKPLNVSDGVTVNHGVNIQSGDLDVRQGGIKVYQNDITLRGNLYALDTNSKPLDSSFTKNYLDSQIWHGKDNAKGNIQCVGVGTMVAGQSYFQNNLSVGGLDGSPDKGTPNFQVMTDGTVSANNLSVGGLDGSPDKGTPNFQVMTDGTVSAIGLHVGKPNNQGVQFTADEGSFTVVNDSNDPHFLTFQDDGNLVIYDHAKPGKDGWTHGGSAWAAW